MSDQPKPREWTLKAGDFSSMGFVLMAIGPSVEIKEAGKGIHVIEKSFFDALEERYEQTCESDNAWREEAEVLSKRVEELMNSISGGHITILMGELSAAKAEIARLHEKYDLQLLVKKLDQANARIAELEHSAKVHPINLAWVADLTRKYEEQHAADKEREQKLVAAITTAINVLDDLEVQSNVQCIIDATVRTLRKAHKGEAGE